MLYVAICLEFKTYVGNHRSNVGIIAQTFSLGLGTIQRELDDDVGKENSTRKSKGLGDLTPGSVSVRHTR